MIPSLLCPKLCFDCYTVAAAASAIVNTGIPLAVIPRGTANAFVHGLGLPNTLKKACIAILQGATRTIGTIDCNGKLMLLLAGIGLEADTVQAANRHLKDQFGMMAYVIASLEQLPQPQRFQAFLETEQETITVPAVAITVANIAPPTSILAQGTGKMRPNDGIFDITILSPASALELLTAAVELFNDGLVRRTCEDRHIGYLRVNEVTITTDPPQHITLDGEIFGTTPATFKVLPQSLQVVMDYNQAVAEQQKLVGLPGVDIVDKQNGRVDEVVLNSVLPVNPVDVLCEQLFQVSEAALALWDTLTTAVKHCGIALTQWAVQALSEWMRVIEQGIKWVLDLLYQCIFPLVERSSEQTTPASSLGAMASAGAANAIRIAHQMSGRIRLKIPRLSFDPVYAERVRSQIQELVGIRDIKINPLSASIAILFEPHLSVSEIGQSILTIVSQLA